MSQNVTRLKELLFDGEARALADLARRIELVADSDARGRKELAADIERLLQTRVRELTAAGQTQALELQRLTDVVRSVKELADGAARRLDDAALRQDDAGRRLVATTQRLDEQGRQLQGLVEREGSLERAEITVASVLDGALRRAELERHDAVAAALAPLVVRTVKTEIRNSQDDLVEALYPMTGRMVKAYVASAMADLIEQVNQRLNSNPLMLRLKSLTTGRSMAELALLETQRLRIEELYLIRRGTGELIGRWPEAPTQANRDQIMSGVLTAINDFASEAFKDEGTALRQIDLEASKVLLRASPTLLLAVRCTGQPHAAVERIIDDEFLEALDRQHHAQADTGGAEARAQLPELARRLDARVAEKHAELTRPPLGLTPLRLAAILVGLPLLAAGVWYGLDGFQTSRVRSVAMRIIETSPEVRGYPISVEVEPWGRAVTVSGLTPTTPAREDLVTRLTDLLPGTRVNDKLSVVPTGGYDTRPQIAMVRNELSRIELDAQRAALTRALNRTLLRLEQTAPDLAALRRETEGAEAQGAVERSLATLEHIAGELRTDRTAIANAGFRAADLGPIRDKLEMHSRELSKVRGDIMGLLGEPATAAAAAAAARSKPAGTGQQGTVIDAAEEMAAQAEQIASTAIAVHQANIVGRRKPAPPPPVQVQVPVSREPTAIERLADFTRANAVFFGNGSEYRDRPQADALIDRVAALVKAAGTIIRVVGFTDDQGSLALNQQLSQARARRVADELISRGVPAERIVAIGRPGFEISPTRGPRSANRRVEFQIGFEGEEVE